MAVHDWTRVEASVFHSFHTVWIGILNNVLNEGLLPDGYYALAEQHSGQTIPDVLTLHASEDSRESSPAALDQGGLAVAEAPPRTRRKHSVDPASRGLRHRSLAIRHISGHRLVALIEIVSPANKDRERHIKDFSEKILSALNAGVHVLLIDLFPPGRHDPEGLHGVLLQQLEESDTRYDLPPEEPLTLASYAADPPGVDIYLEHVGVGADLPEMPLFLRPDRYVNVPLEPTYHAVYRGFPAYWRAVVEGRNPAT